MDNRVFPFVCETEHQLSRAMGRVAVENCTSCMQSRDGGGGAFQLVSR